MIASSAFGKRINADSLRDLSMGKTLFNHFFRTAILRVFREHI